MEFIKAIIVAVQSSESRETCGKLKQKRDVSFNIKIDFPLAVTAFVSASFHSDILSAHVELLVTFLPHFDTRSSFDIFRVSTLEARIKNNSVDFRFELAWNVTDEFIPNRLKY